MEYNTALNEAGLEVSATSLTNGNQKAEATSSSSWLGRTCMNLSSYVTMDRIAELSLAGSVVLGGVLSITADSFQGQMEGVVVAAAASSLVFFAWALGCAAQGNYSKAAKRLVAAGALGTLSYGVSRYSEPVPLRPIDQTAEHSSIATQPKTMSEVQILVPHSNSNSFELVEYMDCGTSPKMSMESMNKVQSLMPYITSGSTHHEIEQIGKYNTKVYSIPSVSYKLLFKVGKEPDKTCNNIIKANEIISKFDLDLMKVPSAAKLVFEKDGQFHTLLVQEKHKFNKWDDYQEDLYRINAARMNKTLSQLTKFIVESGFSDVVWRNAAILDSESDNSDAPPQISLHDLDEMESANIGIFGGGYPTRTGLIRCVAEEDIDLVIAEAERNGLVFTKECAANAKKSRLQQIRNLDEVRTFHSNRGISHGKEPIEVDIEQLGLDLNEIGDVEAGLDSNHEWVEGESMTMRQFAEFTIGKINEEIANSPADRSIRGQRDIYLKSRGDFARYQDLGLSSPFDPSPSWLDKIVGALKEKGLILHTHKNGHGHHIQA